MSQNKNIALLNALFIARLQKKLQQLNERLKTALETVFFPDAVDEWTMVNVHPKLDDMTKLVESAERQIELGALPRDHASKDDGAGGDDGLSNHRHRLLSS